MIWNCVKKYSLREKKENSHKRPYTVWFHFCEMSTMDKSIVIEVD